MHLIKNSISWLFFCIALLAQSVAFGAPPSSKGWTLTERGRDLTLYERTIAGSKIIALRGEGEFKIPLWKIASVLLDTERAKEWVDSLEVSMMVKRISPTSYIEYNHIRTPPIIMKDREFLSEVTITADPIEKSFALRYKPSYFSTGVPVHPEFIRGEMTDTLFYLISTAKGAHTKFVAEIHANPKGSVPSWVVNFFQRGWPRNTYNAMTKQALKPNLKIPAEFSEIIEPTRQFN